MGLALAGLAGCQVAAPAGSTAIVLGPDRTGYIVFGAVITGQSSGFFTADIDRFVAAGATNINIAINSPGGEVVAAEAMIAYMDKIRGSGG